MKRPKWCTSCFCNVWNVQIVTSQNFVFYVTNAGEWKLPDFSKNSAYFGVSCLTCQTTTGVCDRWTFWSNFDGGLWDEVSNHIGRSQILKVAAEIWDRFIELSLQNTWQEWLVLTKLRSRRIAMFQILLQSRSSSQQSHPDRISMTSKDMKLLNVKAGLSYYCSYQSAIIGV